MTTKERGRAAAKRRKQQRVQKQRDQATRKRIAGVYYPIANPEEFFERIGKLRKDAEIAIDRLLAFVDALDDAEPELDADLEPTLGSDTSGPDADRRSQEHWAAHGDVNEREGHLDSDDDAEMSLGKCGGGALGNNDDLEEEFDGREPDAEGEPSLGSGAVHEQISQVSWAWGSNRGDDLEDEHDGTEPGDDDEPLLGATIAFDQVLAWDIPQPCAPGAYEPEADVLDAGEWDEAEHGIADEDGMLEQFGLWCGGITSEPAVRVE